MQMGNDEHYVLPTATSATLPGPLLPPDSVTRLPKLDAEQLGGYFLAASKFSDLALAQQPRRDGPDTAD